MKYPKKVRSFLYNNLKDIFYYRELNDVSGQKYFIQNPLVLIKSKGFIHFSDGFKLKFDKKNKSTVLSIMSFALKQDVHFSLANKQEIGDWVIDYKNDAIITPSKIWFTLSSFDSLILSETFLFDVHFAGFDLKNKVVIEAGAFVGDTALYYANNGAKVYSFEPDKANFDLFKENLLLNKRLAKRITPTKAALGKDGEVQFQSSSGASSIYTVANKQEIVKSLSLKTVLSKFKIKRPYLLHLDVKGSEWDIINQNEISKFSKLRIEYTTKICGKKLGTLEELIRKLKRHGFKYIRIYKHNGLRYNLKDHGTIDAQK